MKQRILFEGEVCDAPLDKILPDIINKAKDMCEDVFVRWNGATLRVSPNDEVRTLMKEYDRQLHAFSLEQAEREGNIIHIFKLKENIDILVSKFIKEIL
jgi:hypothetical protein